MLQYFRQSGARLRSRRRGVSAMEFALVMPIFFAMLVGLVDYGWFFSREAMVTSALEGAVRTGGNMSPAMGESSGCAGCIAGARSYAIAALDELGIDGTSLISPQIIPLQGTCAIRICPTIPHTPLIGLVPNPTSYGAVCTIALAQTVDAC